MGLHVESTAILDEPDHGSATVEREVEGEDVHPRLTEHAELPALGVPADQPPHGRLVHVAGLGDAAGLVERRRRADVRVESKNSVTIVGRI